jgi:NAD(P)H-flavin reductase/ferredoxin
MGKILFRDTECILDPGETVLDGLLRHGFDLAHSCRTGVCQSCLLQVSEGEVPGNSQNGLKETWKQRGYFLPCVCRPGADAVLSVDPLGMAEMIAAEVVSVEQLSGDVMRLSIRTDTPFDFEPGQFISLIREKDDLRRSYSLASLPHEGIVLHIYHWPSGQMSSWVRDRVKPGQRMLVRGPLGECFYTAGHPERPLLMVGGGTGLAPLWGIARQALRQGHTGPITLVHRGHTLDDLYLHEELLELARAHETFTYVPCVAGGGEGVRDGSIDEVA